MKVKSISISRLWKMELPGFINDIVYTLKKYDVEKLHLDFWLKILEKNQKQINTLEKPGTKHPLSEQIAHWHSERVRFASSITMQMKGIVKGDLPNLRQDVRIAEEVVKIFLAKFRKYNKTEINAQTDSFLKAINKDPDTENAFIKLGLMPYIEQLKVAHETHEKLYSKRRGSTSKRLKRDKNKAIKQEGGQALRSFFEQVNVANKAYPELNYAQLINELNYTIAEHTNIINTRATYNKKRALKAKAEKEVIAAAQTNKDTRLTTVNNKPTGVMYKKLPTSESTRSF